MRDFFAQYHSVFVVILGAGLLGLVTGALGCFTVLKRQSLLGDGIAHCGFCGVVATYLLTGNGDFLLIGGACTGILGYLWVISLVKSKKISFDSALALSLTVFFALGLVLLTVVQKEGQALGLEGYLYGQAAAMLKSDVVHIAIVAGLLVIFLLSSWKFLKILTFDPCLAQCLGISGRIFQGILSCFTVCTILLGLQTVGVILISAMLVAPAISARHWVGSLEGMVCLASLLGGLSAVVGTYLSALATGLPTGAMIVLVSSGIALFSMIFGRIRPTWEGIS